MTNQFQGPTLFAAIELWRKMSVASRTAFVKWLAADSSVVLFTSEEVEAKIEQALRDNDTYIPPVVISAAHTRDVRFQSKGARK